MLVSSDSQLIARFRQGDPHAFDALVGKYGHDLFNLAYRLTADAAQAEEITVEVFLSAYQTLRRRPGPADLEIWLYRLAADLCRNDLGARRLYRPAVG